MYCVKCGVELAPSEECCPLCKTRVYHPDIEQKVGKKPFPSTDINDLDEHVSKSGMMFVLTVLFALPIIITLICDLSVNSSIVWSGYVSGAVAMIYVWVILPMWFRAPNPVIFVPCDFAAAALFLCYICYTTGGNWFFTFALPVTGGIAIITCAHITLSRYIGKGYLYIYGGATITLGLFCVMIEYLMNLTFHLYEGFIWSIYPLVIFFMIGMMLIVIAICKPLKNSLKKRFFV